MTKTTKFSFNSFSNKTDSEITQQICSRNVLYWNHLGCKGKLQHDLTALHQEWAGSQGQQDSVLPGKECSPQCPNKRSGTGVVTFTRNLRSVSDLAAGFKCGTWAKKQRMNRQRSQISSSQLFFHSLALLPEVWSKVAETDANYWQWRLQAGQGI